METSPKTSQHVVIDTMMSNKCQVGPASQATTPSCIACYAEDVKYLISTLLSHTLSCLLRHMPTLVVSSTSASLDGKTMEGKRVDNDPK